MVKIVVEIDLRKLGKVFDADRRKVKRLVRTSISRAGQDVKREAQRLIRTSPKAGRVYIYKGKVTRASLPGNPPANQSGALMGSIRSRLRSGGMRVDVGPTQFYAKYLEFGTSKMAARPFMRKALHNKQKDIGDRVRDAVFKGFGL